MTERLPANAGDLQDIQLISGIQEAASQPRQGNWLSRKWTALGAATTAIATVITGPIGGEQSAYAANTEYAVVGMPFDGRWASPTLVNPNSAGEYNDSTSSHPSVHDPYGADWATDIYAGSGTEAKLKVNAVSGNATYSVDAITNTSCNAGKRVRVRINVDGVNVGWIQYEHIDTTLISGTTLYPDSVLGRTRNWGYLPCYRVSSNAGVHLHVGASSLQDNNSCYADHGKPGETVLPAGAAFAMLGSGNNGTKQACTAIPSAPPSGPPPPPPNTDGDALYDYQDECPTVIGTVQNNGCPDNRPPIVMDVNGDNKSDLVHIWSGGVNTWLANGNGTYSVHDPYKPFPAYEMGGFDWRFADVNGDSKTDLLHLWNGGVNTWLSNGDGTYTVTDPNTPIPGYNMNAGFDWETADVNGDGKQDLLHLWYGGVNPWISNGDGTYSLPGTAIPAGYDMISGIGWKVGDFNNDGKDDLLHLWYGGANVWFSNGIGGFAVANTFIPPGYNMVSGLDWKTGDFNGDGSTDLLHIWQSGVNLWQSNGDGTFAVASTYIPPGYNMVAGMDYKLGDVNGDGKTDLLHIWSGGLNSWISNGDGTFTVPNTYLPFQGYSMTGGFKFTNGDVNGDNKTDLLHLWNGGADTWLSNGNGTYTFPGTFVPFSGYGMTGGSFHPGY